MVWLAGLAAIPVLLIPLCVAILLYKRRSVFIASGSFSGS